MEGEGENTVVGEAKMGSRQLGHIFLVTGLASKTVTEVRAAAVKAKIPEDFIHHVKPFNAMKRAIRQFVDRGIAENMVESGDAGILRDKIAESEERFSFQLSARWMAKRGVTYTAAAVITFYKDSGKIECDDKETRRALQELLEECKLIQTSTDIHKVAYQLCDSKFKRLLLKDGVYFCPKNHEDTLEKLKTFYKNLGASFWCQPVGHGDDDEENLARTVIDDMKQHVADIKKRMQDIKDNPKRKGVTPKIAANMIEELRDSLLKYHELADSIRSSADKLLKSAGEAGEVLALSVNPTAALIQMAHKGREISPILFELAQAAEDVPVQPMPEREIKVITSRRAGRKVKIIRSINVIPMRKGQAV